MKKCRTCKQMTVKESHGIAVSKWCVPCKKKNKEEAKALLLKKAEDKKLKHQATKGFIERKFKTLHKKAWGLFTEYIRRKGADEFGINSCYTCGKRSEWKMLQGGHFFHGKLDFDERNIHPQCPGCNMYLSGNLAPYGVRLALELGLEGFERLRLDSNTIRYSNDDLERIIEEYTIKLEQLL